MIGDFYYQNLVLGTGDKVEGGKCAEALITHQSYNAIIIIDLFALQEIV